MNLLPINIKLLVSSENLYQCKATQVSFKKIKYEVKPAPVSFWDNVYLVYVEVSVIRW